MNEIHGFTQVRHQHIPELRTDAELYRHVKTGAEVLSLINEDENKVFGISFRTPPTDSTGVPHILEHSVLCGSRKYPVKEPFVELLKGSLKTFLNAMTYPDKTCYPVASQNVRDFYNLIDVYLDAVFYPRLNPFVLQQEGWHYEVDGPDGPLSYKGVVFNEMKGAYSSPETLLAEYSQQSLFPDTIYGLDSGGDPKQIPQLTYAQFKAFHETYYHPSNARIFFYGDDSPEDRLRILNGYFQDFDMLEVNSSIPLQPLFDRPKKIIRSYASGKGDGQGGKSMFTLNWLFGETIDGALNLAFHMLEYILLGMPGSPLRKALIDSGYGEDIAGDGLATELRQMYFSTGLKGIESENAEKVEKLILTTLTDLVHEGIDDRTVEAALNTIEFNLRENNTGHYPRGLSIMLRSLTTWLYQGDPLALIAFEAPLQDVKKKVAGSKGFFEGLISRYLLDNRHRTTLILKPDPDLADQETTDEKAALSKARAAMTAARVGEIIRDNRKLKELQEAPDSPEALASIPVLKRSDLPKENTIIPCEFSEMHGTRTLYHDLFTNGIVYLDLGFNIH
ncbi:MAG: insulinase family protein, partial [Deltaproteobacteria bacterium]|nr:insulinase family protein [Deltaproteobacteria bacterium]